MVRASHAALLVASIVGFVAAATTAGRDHGDASGTVILTPPSNASGLPAVAIIWIQGASIDASQYQPIAETVQAEFIRSAGLAAWIAIPDFPLDTPDPILFQYEVQQSVASLEAAGMPSGTPLHAFAHSLGGVFLQTYAANASLTPRFETLTMMGTFLQRNYNLTNWMIPTLTIAGEVDGLCRLFRMAENYWRFISEASSPSQLAYATLNFPVVAIGGASHMQFASGTPPQFVQDYDLKPYVTEEHTHSVVARLAAAFFRGQRDKKTDAMMTQQLKVSYATFFAPILNAYELEGNSQQKPPCNCDNPLVPPYGKDPFGYVNFYPCFPDLVYPWCRAGSRWGERMQAAMGGLTNITYNVTSAFHPPAQTKPESNLAHIFNNCSEPSPSCTLTITTVNHNTYEDASVDAGFFPQSAIDIAAKMSSRQHVYKQAGILNANFTELDGGNVCAELNQKALDWALDNAPKDALSRYHSVGQPMVMGPDLEELGPLWIYTNLQYTNATNGTYIVQSPYMTFPDPFVFLPISCCLHYCKLLSPARALEWIMLDSLRLRGSL